MKIVAFFWKKNWGAFWRFLAWEGALSDSNLLEALENIHVILDFEDLWTSDWPKKQKNCASKEKGIVIMVTAIAK